MPDRRPLKPNIKRRPRKNGKGLSQTESDSFFNAINSGQTVSHVEGRPGEDGFTVVRTDGPFRVVMQALRWKFYLAPGFSKAEIDRWVCQFWMLVSLTDPQRSLYLPTTPDEALANIIILPARPGQSAFTLEHEAILHRIHAVDHVNGFKPFARKLERAEACLAQNEWLRDLKWDISLPDLPNPQVEAEARREKEEEEKAMALATEAARRKVQEMKAAK
jgi:hypothetical protein